MYNVCRSKSLQITLKALPTTVDFCRHLMINIIFVEWFSYTEFQWRRNNKACV